MRHGDIVRIIKNNDVTIEQCWLTIALKINDEDIEQGVDVEEPGIYLFRGYWHYNDTNNDPLNWKSYGKIERYDEKDYVQVIGSVETHEQVLKLNI